MNKRLLPLALGGLLLAGAAAGADEKLTMVSWGGAYGRATRLALLEPFAAATGVAAGMDDFNGGLAEIRAQVETGNVHWDVVDLESADAVRGCDEGLLEVIPPAAAFPAGDAEQAAQDFLPGMLSECGIGLVVYSTVYAYRSDRFADARPATMADFFDPEAMARMSRYISYSPTRRSAQPLVTTHLETGVEMAPHMPVSPERLERSVFTDWTWWADYGDEVSERFGAWLAR